MVVRPANKSRYPLAQQPVTRQSSKISPSADDDDDDDDDESDALKDKVEELETLIEISTEREKELEKSLTEQFAATEKATNLAAEMQARIAAMEKAAEAVSKDTSSSDGGSGVTGVSSKKLPGSMKTNLAGHIQNIFRDIKFINEDTFETTPEIMADACYTMGLRTAMDRAVYGNAAKKELKYNMSQKRAYCKKMVMKRYKGK